MTFWGVQGFLCIIGGLARQQQGQRSLGAPRNIYTESNVIQEAVQ